MGCLLWVQSLFSVLASLLLCYKQYCKISNIRITKSQNLIVSLSSCSCLCPIQWSQVLSREWKCSWSSADRRCSNYIWVINNFIARQGVSYIRDLTVSVEWTMIYKAWDCNKYMGVFIMTCPTVRSLHCVIMISYHIAELVQERRNSSALAMELRLSCINPSIWEICRVDYAL